MTTEAPRLLSREEARKRLGISLRNLDKRLMEDKRLRRVQLGRRILISEEALADYIRELEKEAA